MVFATTSCTTFVTAKEAATAYYDLGNAYYDAGRYDDAIKAYQRSRELDPSRRLADYHLVRVHIEAGELVEAERILDGLLADDPENAVLLETLAYLELLKGDANLAVELYEKLYRQRPEKKSVWTNLVSLYGDQGRWDDAVSILEERRQDGEDVTQMLADTLFQAQRYGEAADEYLALSDITEEGPATRMIEALFNTDRYAEALAELKLLVVDFPRSGRLAFLYAWLLYAVVEDDVTGRQMAQTALSLGYDDAEEWERFLALERVAADEDLVTRVRAALEKQQNGPDQETSPQGAQP